MTLRKCSFDLGGGRKVSGVLALPGSGPAADTAVILAHGAGNDMTNPLLSAVHTGIAMHGYPTVKFNFPYKERGGRAPDPAPVLEACWRNVLEAVRGDAEIGARRIVIGGKSMGGRMASHVAAQGADVAGLVFLGYPLHPPGKSQQLRAAHLPKIKVPMLFFAGTRDPLCSLDLLKKTLAKLEAPVTLHVIEGGDHSFKVLKSMKRSEADVCDELVGVTAQWLKNNIAGTSKAK
jgi:predicted alpha/beta-hydrolase family hydrolase